MDRTEIWDLIETVRTEADDPACVHCVAEKLAADLAERTPEQIQAVDAAISALLAESYRTDLWAAAYLINGGASDDGFDYFRGWLVAQGREVFELALADPDSSAELPAVREAIAEGEPLECEDLLSVPWDAYEAVTGEEMPVVGDHTLPDLEPMWDFDDEDEMRERLPRLTALAYDDD